jgi:hypothetical protein
VSATTACMATHHTQVLAKFYLDWLGEFFLSRVLVPLRRDTHKGLQRLIHALCCSSSCLSSSLITRSPAWYASSDSATTRAQVQYR